VRRARKPDEIARAYLRLTNGIGFVGRLPLLSYTEPAVMQFQRLRGLKLNIGAMDLRIAAIVLENAATLVTRNQRDFRRVPGLTIQDWSI
jgi:tRNA(fMet)-specific endonuclease VapC